MTKKLFSTTGLLALLVATVVAIGLFNQLGKLVRVDLTDNQLYTISEGSKNILKSIQQPVELKLFFSNEQTKQIPELRNYARRVQDLLNEYVLLSGGNISLTQVDPQPFSEEEDEAASFGLQAVPIAAAGESIYFGLAATNEAGDQEVIEFFHPNKETFLEYELSQLLARLTNEKPVVVGLMSSLPLQGGFDMASRAPTPPWMVMRSIEQLHEVTTVSLTAERIDDDIDVLILIHPKDLTEQSEYAIDQFVMRGGRLMVFVDPLADIDQGGGMPGMGGSQSSNLDRLFKSWGVELLDGKVLADATHALQVNTGGYRPQTHLGLLSLGADNLASESLITDQLQTITVGTAGIIRPLTAEVSDTEETDADKPAEPRFEPLVQSSDVAMPMAADKFQMLRDPAPLFDDFAPTGETYTVVAQISGEFETAFPDGAPEVASDDADDLSEAQATDMSEAAGEATDPAEPVHLSKATTTANIIIFADTDILSDRLWVRVQDFFGQRIPVPWANNAELVTNALDTLTGSSDLISIRSRGQYSRPFTRVEQLQKAAEQRFREKEKELQQRLTETEQRLTELQQPADEGVQTLSLSPEQQQAIVNFENEKLKIRKQLREVRHQLDKDIKSLGTRIKVYNIIAVPLVLTLIALFFSWRKRKQRRAILI